MEPRTATSSSTSPDEDEEVCTDNPYEQKLYSMFCGHTDKDHRGWLTMAALQQLCLTLELKENGTKLIAALETRCSRKKKDKNIRITFKAFKEELLHVLGTEVCGESSNPSMATIIGQTEDEEEEKQSQLQNGGRLIVDQWSCSVASNPGGGVVVGGDNYCRVVVDVNNSGGGEEEEQVQVTEEETSLADTSKSTDEEGNNDKIEIMSYCTYS